jgi:hypothetical protein
MPIGEAFRQHRNSLAGRIVIVGSVFNAVLAAFYGWKALDIFPGPQAEDFFLGALLCIGIPAALVGTWVSYGGRLRYRPNMPLTVLLLLLSVVPLLLAFVLF